MLQDPICIRYHLAEDTINSNDIERLIGWLKSNPHLTKGELTAQFENRWSQWLGRNYSVFSNSGSSANLLMYYTLLCSGRLRNKKVIVPAAGWVTSIAPAIQFGFEPLMCEADPDTFGLDLNHLEALLKAHRPSTVMLVQVLGVPHKMDAILKLKDQYGFILLEDACAAIGASREDRMVGTFGDMASFSFYFGHQMSTIEGGMVSTDDPFYRDLLLMIRSHGWDKDLGRAKHGELVEKYEIDDFYTPFVFYVPGFNVRSSDLNAFIGLGQMDKLDWIIERRSENHNRYIRNLGKHFYIQRPDTQQTKLCSIHFAILAKSIEERRAVITALIENGIESRIFSAGHLGLHPFWFERYGKPKLPMAERIHDTGLFLPNHPSMNLSDIDFISNVVTEAVCVP
ncbi:MAG: DegT/DnrJ/EryC1/StrS family aminotransferase, partial [Candidatus Omnitrophica bacterium]|nr:DegT/DnrJ/EryC1/StrS family aminotransferase [Candidatus Omnitrophota bacterium]